MEPVDDLLLRPSDPPGPPSPPGKDTRALVGVAIALLLLGAATFWFVWSRAHKGGTPVAATPGAVARRDAGRPTPLGPAVDPTPLPALDESDPLVRDLLGRLSSSPTVAAWLASDDLVRHFVVSVDNIATGATPARHLSSLSPREGFRAVTRGNTTVVDPRTYERYSGVADALTSLDPVALAKLYATLKPRLADAYRELGHPDGDIDVAVERAIVQLLDTPVPRHEIELQPGTVSYKFADQQLEELSPAQKQLLRMGPRNQSAVQRQLWAIGRELGIPPERLPAPPSH